MVPQLPRDPLRTRQAADPEAAGELDAVGQVQGAEGLDPPGADAEHVAGRDLHALGARHLGQRVGLDRLRRERIQRVADSLTVTGEVEQDAAADDAARGEVLDAERPFGRVEILGVASEVPELRA